MRTLLTIVALLVSFQAHGDTLKAKTADITTRDLAQVLGIPLLLKLNIQNVDPHRNLIVTLALWTKEESAFKILKEYPFEVSPNSETVPLIASYYNRVLRLSVGGMAHGFTADEFPEIKESFTSALDANLTPEGYFLMDTISVNGQRLRFTLQIMQNKS